MLILGIETSTQQASVALFEHAQLLATSEWNAADPRLRGALVARVRDLFHSADKRPIQCGGIAVSIGPGSFTGLRIGVACAKTLAYATGCPLVAVDTFEAVAAGSPPDVDRLTVVADAQRKEFFVGDYERCDGEWRSTGPIRIEGAKWLSEQNTGNCLSGPGLHGVTANLPAGALVLDQICWIPRAELVAVIGSRRLIRGERGEPATLEPLYVRRSAAEDKFDGMAGRPQI